MRIPTHRFSLFCEALPQGEQLVRIPPFKDFNSGTGDIYERDDNWGYFANDKDVQLTFYDTGYDFLRFVESVYGQAPDVRLIVEVKDDRDWKETWKVITNVGIPLGGITFDDDKRTAQASTNPGGLLEIIEKRFSDDYDLYPNKSLNGVQLGSLPYKTIVLDPREIFRRSRINVEVGTVISHPVGGGDNLSARAIPFQYVYSSDENVQNTQGNKLSAAGGTYADLSADKVGNVFYLIADRTRRIRLNGTVRTQQSGVPHSGTFHLDLIRYDQGDLFNFAEIIERLDSANPNVSGDIAEYTFNDYEVIVQQGESIAISTIADVADGIKYTILEADLTIEENDLYPTTRTRALKVVDVLDRLVAIMTDQEGIVDSTAFGPGGKYENILLVNGKWLRGVPEIVNEGEEDERRTQASISMENLLGALKILEPLSYRTKAVGIGERFELRTELETQLNKVGVTVGELRDTFVLTQVNQVKRITLEDQVWGRIEIGSTTSGNAYEEVNNLFSTAGNAKWVTINKKSQEVYEVTTEFRTGAEDIELQRQKQHIDRPDRDGLYDDDWFLVDCKPNGMEYVPKLWADHYSTTPSGVFSPETNYNWIFTPARLFLGHGWKLKSGFYHNKYRDDSVSFITSNCNPSIVTQKAGEDPLLEGEDIPHAIIDSPTFVPRQINFKHEVNQEIIDQIRDQDNLDGLVQFLTKDGEEYGRLMKVDTNKEGTWELIEANLLK